MVKDSVNMFSTTVPNMCMAWWTVWFVSEMALMAVIFQEDFTVCGCHSFQIVGYTVFMLDFGLSVKNFPKTFGVEISLDEYTKMFWNKIHVAKTSFFSRNI